MEANVSVGTLYELDFRFRNLERTGCEISLHRGLFTTRAKRPVRFGCEGDINLFPSYKVIIVDRNLHDLRQGAKI